MSANPELKIIDAFGNIKFIDLNSVADQASFSGAVADYKVVDGNRKEGILQGIGTVKAGRIVSYTIPLFDIISGGVNDTWEEQFSKYSSLLNGSNTRQFFLQRTVDGVEYSAKCKLLSLKAYNETTINQIQGFGISVILISNYYVAEDLLTETLAYTGGGVSEDFTIASGSKISSVINFDWTVNLIASDLVTTTMMSILAKDAHGISIFDEVREVGSYKYELIGYVLYRIKDGDENTRVQVHLDGVVPEIDVDESTFTVFSNVETTELIIKYENGILL